MKNKIIIATLLFITMFYGCTKGFLEVKPSSNIVQPKTLDDMYGLLENVVFFQASPGLPIASSDEFEFIDYKTWQSARKISERNAYIWNKDIYGGETDMQDWSLPYTGIFYANNVIANIDKIQVTKENNNRWMFAKGWAHFNRAYCYYGLATSFCKNYNEASLSVDLGLPLKLTPNIDDIKKRSSLGETYAQIFDDLQIAEEMLISAKLPTIDKKNRPSLAAVFALKARMYLNMRQYTKAEQAADACLALHSSLIDYRTITLPNATPFPLANVETIYSTITVSSYPSSTATTFNTATRMSPSVISLYETGDLRFSICFIAANGGFVMNRNYYGSGLYQFTGLATDEVMLIKAECAARRGSIDDALSLLNKLRTFRFTNAAYRPLSFNSATEALNFTLLERRRELVMRGARWQDLKRLNSEGANITLTRELNGTNYTLPPNDRRYIFPIPDDEISMGGLIQNER